MTCDEYLSILATASVDQLGESHLREHANECGWCERVTHVVADRESNLVTAFQNVYSNMPAAVTADMALTAVRRRRIVWLFDIALAIAIAIALWFANADVRADRSGEGRSVEVAPPRPARLAPTAR